MVKSKLYFLKQKKNNQKLIDFVSCILFISILCKPKIYFQDKNHEKYHLFVNLLHSVCVCVCVCVDMLVLIQTNIFFLILTYLNNLL